MLKKAELAFAKDLADFQSKLENKNYISKTRFDLEIEIYQKLSEATLQMVFDNNALFPVLDHPFPDINEEYNRMVKVCEAATYSYNLANKAIRQSAPFIPKEIYEEFCNIRNDCHRQIIMFQDFRLDKMCKELIADSKDQYRACFGRTQEISTKLDDLVNHLREYIAKLDVLDTGIAGVHD